MTKKLLVRLGGGAASELDFADLTPRKGAPFLDANTPLIQMGQRFANGEAAQGYFKVNDPDGNLSLAATRLRAWAEVRLTDDASGDELTLAWMRLSAGDVARSGPYVGGDEIEHNPQLMDCNIDLRGLPFAAQWHRDAETDQERLEALQARKLNGSSSTDAVFRDTTDITIAGFSAGHLCDFAEDTDLDARNYPAGTEPLEVIAEIAEQAGKIFGVVLHHDGGSTHKCLLYIDQDNLSSWTSAVRISDDVADWDPDDNTAPTFEPHWVQGSGKEGNFEPVVSGLVGIYGGADDDTHTVFVDTGEAQEDQEVFVGVYNDDRSENATQATRRANWQLTDRKRPFFSNRVSVIVRADQAHLVEAGQAIETKSVVFESGNLKDTFVWRRVAQKILEPLPDGRYWLHLQLERPRMTSGPNGGAGQPKGTTPRPAPPCIPADPGGVGDPVAGLSLFCVSPAGSAETCGSVSGDVCKQGSAGSTTSWAAIAEGNYYSEIQVATKYGGYDDFTFKAEVRDSAGALPQLTYIDIADMTSCRDGAAWTTMSTTFDVPAGYDEVRFVLSGLGGRWILEDSHTVNEFTPPGGGSENDPDCIPAGTGGDSPFFVRTDDPRLTAPDQHDISRITETVTNNSGGDLEAGDVVVPDTSFDGFGVTTTTTANSTAGPIGIVLDGGADDAEIRVMWSGVAGFVNDGASTAADGDYLFTSTTAGAAQTSATRGAGAFGRVVRDASGDPLYVLLWGVPDSAGGGGGSVATDSIWDAKGDLAAGTGSNTAAKLTVGSNDTILMADSGQSTGLKWVASQTPSTQAFGDSAAEGTADTYARGDHKHAMPSDPVPAHEADTTAHDAEDLVFDPTGLDIVTATDVQAAIAQLDAAGPGGGGSYAQPTGVTVLGGQFTSSSSACNTTITAASAGDNMVVIVGSGNNRGPNSISCTNVTFTQRYQGSGNNQVLTIYTGVVAGGSSGTTVNIGFASSSSQQSSVFVVPGVGNWTAGSAAFTNTSASAQNATGSGAVVVGGYYLCAVSSPVASSISSASNEYVIPSGAFNGQLRWLLLRSSNDALVYWSQSNTGAAYFLAAVKMT